MDIFQKVVHSDAEAISTYFISSKRTIMPSLTQDDDHQISDVILSICECDKVDRRGAKGDKDLW